MVYPCAYIGDGGSSFWYADWCHLGRLCDLVPFVDLRDADFCIKDIVVLDNQWRLGNLSTPLPQTLQIGRL